jgi:hypothetical protein
VRVQEWARVGKGKHIRACRNEHDTTNCKGKGKGKGKGKVQKK